MLEAKYLTKSYEGIWKMNYTFLHPKASAEDIEKAWQAYKASKEAKYDTNGVSGTEEKTVMKNMKLNKGVVIPRVDMYELFKRYLEELQSGRLHDDLANSRSPMRLTNMMVSYSEAYRALRFQCDEGTVTLCICDKPNGDDTIYYRPGNAPKGVGFGTPVWTISENGDKFIRHNEAIEKTDIGFSSDVIGKQAIFSTVISHLRNFRCEYVPPSVIG